MYILHQAYLQAGKKGRMLRDALIMSIIIIEPQLGLGLSCRYGIYYLGKAMEHLK